MPETISLKKLDFGASYRELYTGVRQYLTGLTHNHDLSHDLAQDTFERVFRNITSFREGENFAAWVYTIARNIAFDYFRKRKIRQGIEILAEACTSITPEDEAVGREAERRLNDFLINYKSTEAVEAFVLDLEELSDQEISQRQGLHIGALKSRLHTLRRRALEHAYK